MFEVYLWKGKRWHSIYTHNDEQEKNMNTNVKLCEYIIYIYITVKNFRQIIRHSEKPNTNKNEY